MTRRSTTLESRLVDWARVYGGGRYDLSDGLKSPMGSMIKWGGRPPSGLGQDMRTPEADQVNDAIRWLEKSEGGMWAAWILRCEYLTPGQPVTSKLDRLKKIGGVFSDAEYRSRLEVAKGMIASKLHIRYEAPLCQL